jgi:hypothetical protein
MTASMSSRYHDYQSHVLTIYGVVLACYVPAFLVMLLWLRAGIRTLWCLVAAGMILFFASGMKSGLVLVTGLSVCIPLIGKVVSGLRSEHSEPAP